MIDSPSANTALLRGIRKSFGTREVLRGTDLLPAVLPEEALHRRALGRADL